MDNSHPKDFILSVVFFYITISFPFFLAAELFSMKVSSLSIDYLKFLLAKVEVY